MLIKEQKVKAIIIANNQFSRLFEHFNLNICYKSIFYESRDDDQRARTGSNNQNT